MPRNTSRPRWLDTACYGCGAPRRLCAREPLAPQLGKLLGIKRLSGQRMVPVPIMTTEDHQDLQNRFAKDIAALEELLETDRSYWK